MLRATDSLFNAVQNVDRKLDTMEWKINRLEENESIIFDGNKLLTASETVDLHSTFTTSQLIKNFSSVQKKYEELSNEIIISTSEMEKSSQNLNSIMHKVAKKFEDLSQYVSDK